MCFFFFKQKTAYEMRISDWSSDVCSSDLLASRDRLRLDQRTRQVMRRAQVLRGRLVVPKGHMRFLAVVSLLVAQQQHVRRFGVLVANRLSGRLRAVIGALFGLVPPHLENGVGHVAYSAPALDDRKSVV